jgi:uncharacterized integral membrane protein (TIGR00698 family)
MGHIDKSIRPEHGAADVSSEAPRRPMLCSLVAWAGGIGPGLVVAAAIALVARLLTPVVQPVPDVVLALAIGIVVRNSFRGAPIEPGAKFVVHYVLRGAIVLIGASFTLQAVAARGLSVLGLVVSLVAIAFVTGLALAKLARLSSTMGVLIGAGTAICGATAILIVSPIVRAQKAETAYAVATIFTFNVLALVLYPVVGHLLNLNQAAFGTWSGTAVNDTSVVIATAFAYGHGAGAVATITKLTRTLLLLPLAVLLAAMYRSREDGAIRAHTPVRKALPLFILGFVGVAALRSLGILPAGAVSLMTAAASIGIVMVLASVGLSVDLKSLARLGPKAFLVGLVLGAVMSAISLGAILVLGL